VCEVITGSHSRGRERKGPSDGQRGGLNQAHLAIGRFALANGKMFTWRDCKRARLPDADRRCGACVLISALVITSKESPDMTTWPSLTAAPPRDPNVDDDEEEEGDDEVDDDREPAVIREPDEGE
jgi:hypothetical protein